MKCGNCNGKNMDFLIVWVELLIKENEFSGKMGDWESWFENYLSQGKQKGYKKLLMGSESKVRVEHIPMQAEFKQLKVVLTLIKGLLR